MVKIVFDRKILIEMKWTRKFFFWNLFDGLVQDIPIWEIIINIAF